MSDIDPSELDRATTAELSSLAAATADLVARHLVAAGHLLDEDVSQALRHTVAAKSLASRLACVREAHGITCYLAGDYAGARRELQAHRRMTGRSDHLPILADCERALGHPERALSLAADPGVDRLDRAARAELTIVLAGARRDLGQLPAAIALLTDAAKGLRSTSPGALRLWYALADALEAAGDIDGARRRFAAVAEADLEGDTDAGERLLAL